MKKKQITGKTIAITAVIGSILILAILTINTVLSYRQSASATNDAVSAVSSFYLESMADRRAKTITNLINNNFDQMEKALEVIDEEGIGSQEELRAMIGKIESLLSLNRFAMVDEDNIVYTHYTTYTGGSRHSFLAEEKMEDRIVSTVYLYGSSRQLCLAVPTDIRMMGKPFKACFVQIDIRDIVSLLAFDEQAETSFGLYSGNGGNLSGTELGSVISDQNILEATKDMVSPEDWDALCMDFAEGKEGSLTFASGSNEETFCYVPIPDTGWQVVVMIHESVIHEKIRGISENSIRTTRFQVLLTLGSALIFAVVLLLQLRKLSKDRIEAEKEKSRNFRSMANTDSMTGVRNKHAYAETELAINLGIKENEIEKLGIVVCDINGLKHVNDTLGHAAGDQLIKDASALICEYFTHGQVYRIGGDEFTVLLLDKGFDTMQEVIDDLNRTVEENIQKDAVVISIGHSTLKPEDEQLRDVFERADQMMYTRKKQLKEMGAKTRT